jgi:hypothetical protein
MIMSRCSLSTVSKAFDKPKKLDDGVPSIAPCSHVPFRLLNGSVVAPLCTKSMHSPAELNSIWPPKINHQSNQLVCCLEQGNALEAFGAIFRDKDQNPFPHSVWDLSGVINLLAEADQPHEIVCILCPQFAQCPCPHCVLLELITSWCPSCSQLFRHCPYFVTAKQTIPHH